MSRSIRVTVLLNRDARLTTSDSHFGFKFLTISCLDMRHDRARCWIIIATFFGVNNAMHTKFAVFCLAWFVAIVANYPEVGCVVFLTFLNLHGLVCMTYEKIKEIKNKWKCKRQKKIVEKCSLHFFTKTVVVFLHNRPLV